MDMIAEASHVARHEAVRAAIAAGGGADPSRTAQGGEFLTFRLGAEEYGIDILRVQEIRSYEQPTRIANAPAFIKGVVNLRGVIVPIIDLRLKLNCDTAEYNTFTVVVVLNVRGRVVGAVVDSVSDVLALTPAQIRTAVRFAQLATAGEEPVARAGQDADAALATAPAPNVQHEALILRQLAHADRAVVLQKGSVVLQGASAELRGNAALAEFLGV